MALRNLLAAISELHENGMPRGGIPVLSQSASERKEYVRWDEVKAFLIMAEEALRARASINENLKRQELRLLYENRLYMDMLGIDHIFLILSGSWTKRASWIQLTRSSF